MNCYFSKNYKGFNAGNKAKMDVESIMDNLGFRNVGFGQTHYNNKVSAYFRTLGSVLKAMSELKKGDVLILQYPLKKYYEYVCRRAHRKGAKVVTLVHDLGSFRRKKLTIEREIERLNHSDYIIATNDTMKQWLAENGCRALLGSLQVWDYLSTTSAPEYSVSSVPRVIYAGSLSRRKNQFLYDIESYIRGYSLLLYGSGFEENIIQNKNCMMYKGFISSDDLIAQAEGEYGLVWDGCSLLTCEGAFGEYLRYNTPHKVSLYLRCELPVIVWEESAMADYIRENRAGICVASLENLGEVLGAVTPEAYAEMKANAREVGKRLSEGYSFTRAVNKAIAELSE